jgi:hypothetical protein
MTDIIVDGIIIPEGFWLWFKIYARNVTIVSSTSASATAASATATASASAMTTASATSR